MSFDAADDLHYAEDGAADLARALRRMVSAARRADAPDVMDDAAHVLRGWDAYCRPTCRAEGGQDDCLSADDECGCPCHVWTDGKQVDA